MTILIEMQRERLSRILTESVLDGTPVDRAVHGKTHRRRQKLRSRRSSEHRAVESPLIRKVWRPVGNNREAGTLAVRHKDISRLLDNPRAARRVIRHDLQIVQPMVIK